MKDYPLVLQAYIKLNAKVYLSNSGDYEIEIQGFSGVHMNTRILIKGENVFISPRKLFQLIEKLKENGEIELTHPVDEILFSPKDNNTLEILFDVNLNNPIEEIN